MLLTSIKDEQSATLKKWKSRFVALGNRLYDFYGGKIEEELRHFIPCSLGGVRVGLGYELLVPDGCSLRGDVPGAYLTAALSGPPTFIEIPREHVPPHWNQAKGYRRPVRPVTGALYGLPRGDTDWGFKAERTILSIPGAEKIVDFAEGSMFVVPSTAFPRRRPATKEELAIPGRPPTGWPTLIVLYSDDYNTSGETACNVPVHQLLAKELGCQPQDNYHYEQMIGLQRLDLPPDPVTGARRMIVHQDDYIQFILRDSEQPNPDR